MLEDYLFSFLCNFFQFLKQGYQGAPGNPGVDGPKGQPVSTLYLTNRFHVDVRLFSNRSQMTSKCGKNKKVVHEA